MSHPEPPTPTRSPSTGRPAVTWRKATRVVVGTILTLLGLLWMLQGADLVHIRPIGCVAQCQPITGGSSTWFTIGVLTLLGGLTVLGARRRRR